MAVEKRFKKIFVMDGDNILPSLDVFYGPYASVDEAIQSIAEFCDEQGVDIPAGIKFAVNNDGAISEFKYVETSNGFTPESVSPVIETVEDVENTLPEDLVHGTLVKDEFGEYTEATGVYAEIKDVKDVFTASLDEVYAKFDNLTDNDTVYDDTEIKNRLDALEAKEDADTVYDDTELSNRIAEIESQNLNDRVATLEAKEDKDTIYDDTLVVKYQEFQRPSDPAPRKTVQLANHDNISAMGANCTEGQPNGYEGGEDLSNGAFNLVMMSKWNVADFGANAVSMNLNSKNGIVTINDDKVNGVVATTKYVDDAINNIDIANEAYDDTEIKSRLDALEAKEDKDTIYDDTLNVKYQEFQRPSDPAVRRTVQLANHDNISAMGANCTEGQPNGYEGGEDLSAGAYNLVMLSKWNVADFGASAVSMNLNSKDGVVTINDDKVNGVVATTKYVQDVVSNIEGVNDPEVLANLASKDYVDEAVANVKVEEDPLTVKYQEFQRPSDPAVRKTLQLGNHDNISAMGANCTEGQPNGYVGGEDLSTGAYNLVMMSKWNVADFGASAVSMNLNSKDGVVTINDDKENGIVATTKYVDDAIEAVPSYDDTEVKAAIDEFKTMVFRKESNGNVEINAKGLFKVDASGVITAEPASLDLAGDDKVAIKGASMSLETDVVNIPVKISKKNKVSYGAYEQTTNGSLDAVESAMNNGVYNINFVIDENNSPLAELQEAYPAGTVVKSLDLVSLAELPAKVEELTNLVENGKEEVEVDLSGYAKESYVDDALISAKEYTDQKIQDIQLSQLSGTIDLAGYATEAYVDEAIANIKPVATVDRKEVESIIEDMKNPMVEDFGSFKIRVRGNGDMKSVSELTEDEATVTVVDGYTHINVKVNASATEVINNTVEVQGFLKGTITIGSENDGLVEYTPLAMVSGMIPVEDGEYMVNTNGSTTEWWKDEVLSFVAFDGAAFADALEVKQISSVIPDPELSMIDPDATITINTYYVKYDFDAKLVFAGDTLIEGNGNSNKVIYYAPISKTLKVEVPANTHVYVKDMTIPANNNVLSDAVIYSAHNMEISGLGYLTVTSENNNHAIKACADMVIEGYPHIYLSAKHDAIHGTDLISVKNGVFYVENAKDAFGTGDFGKIEVFDGTFYFNNYKENAFDAKASGLVYHANINEVDGGVRGKDMFNNVHMVTGADYAEGHVYTFSSVDSLTGEYVDLVDVEAVSGVYEVNATNVRVTGHIEGCIRLNAKSTTLIIEDAYVENYSTNAPVILYNQTGKNVDIKAYGINYIYNAFGGPAIKSLNNTKFRPKKSSITYVIAENGNGIETGGFVVYDGKGDLYVTECQEGIVAEKMFVGNENAYGSSNGYVNAWEANVDSGLAGNIYALNNEVDIHTKHYAGQDVYGGVYFVQEYNSDKTGMKGYVYTNKVNVEGINAALKTYYAESASDFSGIKYDETGYEAEYEATVQLTNKNIDQSAIIVKLMAMINELSGKLAALQ